MSCASHTQSLLIAERTKQKAGRMVSGLLLAFIGGGHHEAGRTVLLFGDGGLSTNSTNLGVGGEV